MYVNYVIFRWLIRTQFGIYANYKLDTVPKNVGKTEKPEKVTLSMKLTVYIKFLLNTVKHGKFTASSSFLLNTVNIF